ncbi:hypothetical protein HanPI659440_Chr05g0191381 [Helianthus annuus]|nr:hypothetical protein HanPI659440_Chr05g0191381 [Helianthus annuus]
MSRGNRVSVFDRLNGLEASTRPVGASVVSGSYLHGNKTYSSVVKTGGEVHKVNIDLPPLNTVTKKSLEYKSLIGETKDIETLNNLKENLSGVTEEGLKLKYLGGLKVLLCFNSPEEAEEFRYTKMDVWEKWFARLYLWEGIPPVFERIAWIKVLGVPASLWDRHVINKIGERCGRLLVKSEADSSDGNMAEDRLAILVNTGKRIALEFNLVWKEQRIPVWVEEISGKWSPEFLINESPGLDSPVLSSEYEGSVSSGENVSNSCLRDFSFACMENHQDCTSPNSKEARMSGAAHEESCVQQDFLNKEREEVGPFDNNAIVNEETEEVGPVDQNNILNENNAFVGPDGVNWVNDPHCGNSLESTRPSYITLRPKRCEKKTSKAREAVIPDLNQTVENSRDIQGAVRKGGTWGFGSGYVQQGQW